MIAQGVIVAGDPRAGDRQLAALQRVTAADVQRVARRYLGDAQSATLRYLPATAANPAGTGDTVAVAGTVQVAPLAVPSGVTVTTPAPEGQRIAPPAPGAPVAARVPTPVESRLANGMRVVVVERRDLPLVTASLVVSGGGALDPVGRAGVNNLAATLLTKGTATRSATQIAQAVESLGGSIGSAADWDGAGVTVNVKSDQLDPAMAILADVARNPAFADAELARARTQAIDGVRVELANPATIAGYAAQRAVFGDGAYGQVLGGTTASLAAITRADILAAYRASWQPDRATLVLVGDVTPAQGQALAERLFGSWRAAPGAAAAAAPAPGAAAPAAAGPAAAPRPRVIVVDMPGAGQAGVVVARPGVARADPDYYPSAVANAVLGGGFSGRLNQEIRIRRGLAYGAGSSLQARRLAGPVAASTQTKNDTADEVVTLIVEQMRRIGAEPVPAAEMATRQAVLIGSFGRRVETNAGIADALTDYAVQAVPMAELQRLVPQVAGVTPATLQAAARRVLDPAGASIVVVGEARQFIDQLRAAYPNVEVIPLAALNLDRTELRGN